MSRRIIDVHSISSAQGWLATEYGLDEPVVCFALVSTINTNSNFPEVEKVVIALSKDEDNLMGTELTERHTNYHFPEG